MKTEDDAIEDEELLLRRSLVEWVDLNLELPVSRVVFRPTEDDSTGISFFREFFSTPAEVVELTEKLGRRPRNDYCVIRMPVCSIRDNGMSINPDPIELLKGHALLPEIKSTLRRQSKKYQVRLASWINQNLNQDSIYYCGPVAQPGNDSE